MPIYEYYCAACDSKKDKYFSRRETATDTWKCRDCGAIAKRVISAPAKNIPIDWGVHHPSTGGDDE